MFTGIVETVGEVCERTSRGGAVRLGIASSLPTREMRPGQSVAVDGVCLTVVETEGDRLRADVIPETLRLSTLGDARPGRRVNLERALRLGDRLDGHLVQGHVDGTARVRGIVRAAGDWRVRLVPPPEMRRYVAYKGSIALAGVSLTVAGLDAESFEVALIPETLERTTLGQLSAGQRVNVEVDLVARYLERLEGRPGAATRPGGIRRGDHD